MLLGLLFWLNSFTLPTGAPKATIDLMTREGAAQVKGEWRYSDVKIVDTEFLEAGGDGQPSERPNRAQTIVPQAGGADYDDSAWQRIAPNELSTRRGNGRLSFNWYRINVRVPDKFNGADVVFETTVDDYAEIWVDGELTRGAGQSGGSVVGGWNAPNRLLIAKNAKAGQRIQLAVFGMNGPISNPPTNYIFMHAAKLEFHPGNGGPFAPAQREVNVRVDKKDAALDAIVPLNPKVYKLAEGFQFTEGPVWVTKGRYLLFSDPNANRIYKYEPGGTLSVFREESGYSGADIAEYGQPGSNGLAVDRDGRLTIDQHGNRRVVRLNGDGSETVLADRFEGKRLNSPNDLVYRRDGALFFTDPFFGLPKFDKDPRKELPFSGVYSLHNGKLRLVTKQLPGPNGIAFSPDEKFLYVGNWQEDRKVVMRYPVNDDATTGEGELFFDMTSAGGEDAIDGIKVDIEGNLFVSGPGGIWVLSENGRHLGTIVTPKHVHNMAWGDDDGRTLYLCARDGLYKMRLLIPGASQ